MSRSSKAYSFVALLGSLLCLVQGCSVAKDTVQIEPHLLPLGAKEDMYLSGESRRLNARHSFLLYRQLKNTGNNADAWKHLYRAIEFDPASAYLQLTQAQEWMRFGNLEYAEESMLKAFRLAPQDPEIKFEYAQLLAVRDKESEALVMLEKLLEGDPSNESYLSALISIDLRRDDYWVAIARLKDALKINPNAEYLYYRKGRIYREMGKIDQAQKAFERALRLDPSYFQALTYLAILLEEKGEELKAVEIYEQLASRTNNAIYHRKLSALYMKNKQFKKAVASFQNLLQIEPTDMNSLLQMSRAWIELGDLQKSEESFRDLLHLDPSNGSLHFMLGILLDGQGRSEEALYHYVQIPETSNAYYDSLPLRLKAFHELDQKEKLLEYLDKSVELAEIIEDQGKSLHLFRVAAQYWSQLNEYQKSEKVLSQALQKFPTNQALMYQKGMVMEKQQRFEDGVKIMLSILSVNPEHAGALNYVGYTWADQNKNLQDAEVYIKKALDLAPNDPHITDSLGWVFYRQGRYEEAYEALFSAFKAVPREFVIVDHLADVLVKLGRLSEARDYYVRALQLQPERPEDIEKVRSKLEKIESQMPQEIMGRRWESSCEGLANRRCSVHRLQLEGAVFDRNPAQDSR